MANIMAICNFIYLCELVAEYSPCTSSD